MTTINTLNPQELNAIIRNIPPDNHGAFAIPKGWTRVDVGNLETYVGDSIYIITLIEKLPRTMTEMESDNMSVEQVVTKYLRDEGFIGEEYAYIGLQRFDLANPPEGLI